MKLILAFITFVILVLMLQQVFIESKERQFFKTHSTSMTKFFLRRHFSDDRTIALVVDETVKLSNFPFTLKTQIIREREAEKIFLGSRILFESHALIVHFFQIQITYKYFKTSLFNLYSVKTFKIDAQRV